MNVLMQVRLAVAIAVALAAFAVWMLLWRRKTGVRRVRVAAEDGRLLQTTKSTAAAERELKRQRRVQVPLRPLRPEEAEQFTQAWRTVRSRFPHDPRTAVSEANRLVEDVMRARGYVVDAPAHQLSIDHAAVLNHYRTGREIVLRHGRGEASAEDLRKAMVHFRALSDELVTSHSGYGRRAS